MSPNKKQIKLKKGSKSHLIFAYGHFAIGLFNFFVPRFLNSATNRLLQFTFFKCFVCQCVHGWCCVCVFYLVLAFFLSFAHGRSLRFLCRSFSLSALLQWCVRPKFRVVVLLSIFFYSHAMCMLVKKCRLPVCAMLYTAIFNGQSANSTSKTSTFMRVSVCVACVLYKNGIIHARIKSLQWLNVLKCVMGFINAHTYNQFNSRFNGTFVIALQIVLQTFLSSADIFLFHIHNFMMNLNTKKKLQIESQTSKNANCEIEIEIFPSYNRSLCATIHTEIEILF